MPSLFRAILTALLLLPGFANVQSGDDIAAFQARQLYVDGYYPDAFAMLQPLAQKGHPCAQTISGRMFENGDGVPADTKSAVELYHAATIQGFAAAMHNLGYSCEDGFGAWPRTKGRYGNGPRKLLRKIMARLLAISGHSCVTAEADWQIHKPRWQSLNARPPWLIPSVTSLKLIGLFLKQVRLKFVSVLHRMQGCLAAQGWVRKLLLL